MKRFFSLLAISVALASIPAYALDRAAVDASDSRITYTGRILASGGAVSFDWSGVTASVRFEGTGLEMQWSDTGRNFFNVWIDKASSPVADTVIASGGADCTVKVASGLPFGIHTVIIQKRTEGEQGRVTIRSFATDGRILPSGEVRRKRRIEFVGDSYTCGYGTESAGRKEPFRPETENCNLAYAAIIGRFFDADIQLVSHSGCGLVRNYADTQRPTMTDRYPFVFDESSDVRYNASKAGFKPDIVVVYLGTNDFSLGRQPSLEAWRAGYARLIGMIAANYGREVPVLCVSSKADKQMGAYVRAAAEGIGRSNVSWTSIEDMIHNDDSEMGASDHPKYAGQRKVACHMIPYISTMTGWEMPVKPIE